MNLRQLFVFLFIHPFKQDGQIGIVIHPKQTLEELQHDMLERIRAREIEYERKPRYSSRHPTRRGK